MTQEISCDELVKYLSDYIDNNLSEELSEIARDHMETCDNCRVVLDSTQRTIRLYREHGKAQTIPHGRHQRLYNTLLDIFLNPTDESENPM